MAIITPMAQECVGLRVFGGCPTAWYVTVTAEDMGFREGLTEIAQRGVEDALERVRELIG